MLLSAIANRRTALEQSALKDYVWTIRTTTSNETFTLPFLDGYTYDCHVQWGDGTDDRITAFDQAEATHTYAVAGDYQVRFHGLTEAMDSLQEEPLLPFKNQIISVDQIGDTGLIYANNLFRSCPNFVSHVDGTYPDLVTPSRMFMQSPALAVQPVLNMPNATDLLRLFQETVFPEFKTFPTGHVNSFGSTFRGNLSITTLPPYDFSSATSFANAYTGSSNLADVPAGYFDDIPGPISFINAFNTCGLTETSVNNILISLDSVGGAGADWTGLTISIQSGTSAAPTGAGLTAKTSLQGKGATVTTN